MYLSKIEIFGFKSFAQKTELNFDAGLTAIVGPNGCGKTNVVDAIRWTLGEQRPTTLRSDKMEDVIFNGTKSRKPLGMSEVSLTIENSKGILPTEFSEVTITRRVYRSGEGEYLMNRTPCRLKDIRDLFMDTGMGSDAYSVIELKMVETILSDRAEERRRLFEEAAGVTKYKHRRKETYRRLESVQHDLTRVADITREVQKAVNSLERQAQKAERYNEYALQLQIRDKDLLEREYAALMSKIVPLQGQLSVAVDEKNRIDVGLKREETLLEVLRSELMELETRSQEIQNLLIRRQDGIHQLDQRVATATERKRSLLANIERYEKEKIHITEQRGRIDQTQGELNERLRSLAAALTESEEKYQLRKDELDEFELQLNTKKGELKSSQDRMIALLHEISGLRAREGQTKAKIDNLTGRIDYMVEENSSLRIGFEKNAELVVRLTAEDKELRKKFTEADVKAHQAEDRKGSLRSELDALRVREMELRGLLERKEARRDFLRGLVESWDGLSEGAKYLISSSEWGSVIRTTVGEAFSIAPKHRIAIESSLGESAGYIIVDTAEDAYSAIEFLKKNDKGKATFVCLNRVPHVANHRPSLNLDGIVGWAYDLVGMDSRYTDLYRFLLAGTLIVNDVPSAIEIVKEERGIRCITLDGEIVTGKGVLRGGSARQDEGGHISRRAQLEELADELKQIQNLREEAQAKIEKKAAELSGIDAKEFFEKSRSIEQEMITVEVKIAQLEFEKKRAEETVARNNSEIERLRSEIDALRAELGQFIPSLNALESEKLEADQRSGAVSAELGTMEVLWNEYSRLANEANLAVLSLKSEERSTRQNIEHNAELRQSLLEAFEQRTLDIASAQEEVGLLETEISETEAIRQTAREEIKLTREQKKVVDQDHNKKRGEVHQIELRLKDERLRHEGSLKATHELEFKIQEFSMKAENLRVRAKEEFEMELEVREFENYDTFDFTAARDEVRSLKEKLRALGAINFAAFDEYKSEKERLDFVIAQRVDLEESEKTLLQTIEEINTTAQNKFLDTFKLIRENFVSIFKGLFDEGDECNLKLEDGVDPLEARIEITAKPRGKRPTSIDLLSGGEKTLTAIALLFAIYLVKPSPFCILDEVDAPLDDSNIDRFTRILDRFSNNTQFIVVTHNKRTMESANALYGVTMEEEGVSKLVSVRFDQPVAAKG